MDYKLFYEMIADELERIEDEGINGNWDLMRFAGALVTLIDLVDMRLNPKAFYGE